MKDTITELRIRNVRCVAEATLPLRGLTVLIGDNGSGKSTILEALDLLHRLEDPDFIARFDEFADLRRSGTSAMTLGVTIEGDGPPLRYDLTWSNSEGTDRIVSERLTVESESDPTTPQVLIDRHGGKARWAASTEGMELKDDSARLEPWRPMVARCRLAPHVGMARTSSALQRLDVHGPFDTRASWLLSRDRGIDSTMRLSLGLTSALHLERGGGNLSDVYFALKNRFDRAHWDETLDLVRLGFGPEIEDLGTMVGEPRGPCGLWLKRKGMDANLSSAQLSDGQIAYLGFVALVRLIPPVGRSLLAFDDPDLHLHPNQLGRVIGLFERAAQEHPVILATHSHRLLDVLSDPAASVVHCELDENGATRFLRPDKTRLNTWLTDHDGLGAVLDAGYLRDVFHSPSPNPIRFDENDLTAAALQAAAIEDESEPTVTGVVNAILPVLPPPLRLRHGPLMVTLETWSDGRVVARFPAARLYGEGATDVDAIDALSDEIAALVKEIKSRADAHKIAGVLQRQWAAVLAVVDVGV